MEIVELSGEEGWRRAYPVMRELRPHHSEASFVEVVREMAAGGYRIIAAEDDGEVKALAGIGTGRNLYYGRYLWVYELITTEAARSMGYGEQLLSAVEEMGRAEGCETIALSSAMFRNDAHRFYEDRMSYDKAGYVFVKKLED